MSDDSPSGGSAPASGPPGASRASGAGADEVQAEILRPSAAAGRGPGTASGGDPGWPEPTDEEVAAIVAAIEVTRPRAVAPPQRDQAPRWRFSGRWWTKPVPLRRSRPW